MHIIYNLYNFIIYYPFLSFAWFLVHWITQGFLYMWKSHTCTEPSGESPVKLPGSRTGQAARIFKISPYKNLATVAIDTFNSKQCILNMSIQVARCLRDSLQNVLSSRLLFKMCTYLYNCTSCFIWV